MDILSDIEIIIHRTGADIAPRPKVAAVCHRCNGEIFEGEKYMDFDGEIICPECVDEMSAKEVFNMFDYYFRRASI